MSAPTVDQIRELIDQAIKAAMSHPFVDRNELADARRAVMRGLSALSEELDRLRLDAQRWNAVRTRFPLHGHPIITPQSADDYADGLIAGAATPGSTPSAHPDGENT